jgi:hypothetical protein
MSWLGPVPRSSLPTSSGQSLYSSPPDPWLKRLFLISMIGKSDAVRFLILHQVCVLDCCLFLDKFISCKLLSLLLSLCCHLAAVVSRFNAMLKSNNTNSCSRRKTMMALNENGCSCWLSKS